MEFRSLLCEYRLHQFLIVLFESRCERIVKRNVLRGCSVGPPRANAEELGRVENSGYLAN